MLNAILTWHCYSSATPFRVQGTTQAHLRTHTVCFSAPRVGRKHRLAQVTNHSDVDPRLKQFMDDFPVVATQNLHLVDKNFVVKRLKSS